MVDEKEQIEMADEEVEEKMADGIETRITLTHAIKKFLNEIMNDSNCTRSLKMKIRIALMKNENESIAYDVLTDAHEFYSSFRRRKKGKEFIELHTLVKSSKVFNEPIPEPVRSPDLVQRLNRLKAEQSQREYDGMVKNVKRKNLTLGQEFGQAYRTSGQQLMSIVNFLISIAAAFAFGFVSSQYAFSDDLGLRLVFSIVVATVVAVAELYFMAKSEI